MFIVLLLASCLWCEGFGKIVYVVVYVLQKSKRVGIGFVLAIFSACE